MIEVKKFLFWSLETGGQVIGWFTIVISALQIAILSLTVCSMSVMSCETLKEFFDKQNYHEMDIELFENCANFKTTVVTVMVIVTLFSVGSMIIGVFCIKGTSQRNYRKIRPMVILLAFYTVLSIIDIFKFSVKGVLIGICITSVEVYCFLCIASLHKKFKKEFGQGDFVEYVPNFNKV